MAKGKKFKTVEEMAEYMLDIALNGSEELGINDACSFNDWLINYLSDIAYGY